MSRTKTVKAALANLGIAPFEHPAVDGDRLALFGALAAERAIITDAIKALHAEGWPQAPRAEVILLVERDLRDRAGVVMLPRDEARELRAIVEAAVDAFIRSEVERK